MEALADKYVRLIHYLGVESDERIYQNYPSQSLSVLLLEELISNPEVFGCLKKETQYKVLNASVNFYEGTENSILVFRQMDTYEKMIALNNQPASSKKNKMLPIDPGCEVMSVLSVPTTPNGSPVAYTSRQYWTDFTDTQKTSINTYYHSLYSIIGDLYPPCRKYNCHSYTHGIARHRRIITG